MKTQVRRGVFETNSSSVHSISIVKNEFNGKLPSKLIIDCDAEFGCEVDTFDDSSSKAAYIYQAIRYYPTYNSYTKEKHNIKDEKEIIQNLMNKFISNIESYGVKVDCKYRFTKINSIELEHNKTYDYIVFVDENGNEDEYGGYLDHGEKAKELVDYVLSSPENTIKFIFDDRCYINTGNDNEDNYEYVKDIDEDVIIFEKGN